MWHWLSDNAGKTDVIWSSSLEMKFSPLNMGQTLVLLFLSHFFLPRDVLHFFFLCTFFFCLSVLVLIDMVQSNGNSRKDFHWVNQTAASTQWMPCLKDCVFVCKWKCLSQNKHIEKVGRKGAPRWKGRGALFFFLPHSPPCSFSPSEQLFTSANRKR